MNTCLRFNRYRPILGFIFGLLGLITYVNAQSPAPDLALNPPAVQAALDPQLPTIFIVGDSTAAKNNGQPIQGWAVPFAHSFDLTKVNVANRARGGRSSRTFITEGLWDEVLAEMKPGDLVLIQFGHNDDGAINEEPPGSARPLRARGSLPGTGDDAQSIVNAITKKPEVVHTYGWYIQKMVTDVKAKGATPFILSPTVRNIWTNHHVERGIGEYRVWDRSLGVSLATTYVDLARIVADEYEELGEEKVKSFFPRDHTHVNEAGAEFNARAVVAGLKGIHDGPFGKFLSAEGEAVAADNMGWLNLPEPAKGGLPSLVLIGDSTVRNGRGDGASGQWGWGDSLPAYFDLNKINVVNRAVGGTSSRTFTTQKYWEKAEIFLKPGDFLLIQFGHNDDGALNDTSRARGTIKGVGEETVAIENLLTHQAENVHTYGWYLRQFVREAKARGVTPIICTPIPRKTWAAGKIVLSENSYASWARQIAAQEGAGLIDLNRAIAQRYNELGQSKVDAFFADPHTHTSLAGADLNATFVIEGLKALPGHPLATFFSLKSESIPVVLPVPAP